MDPQVQAALVGIVVALVPALMTLLLTRRWSANDLREERAHSLRIMMEERAERERSEERAQAERDREARTALLYRAEFDAGNEIYVGLVRFGRAVHDAMGALARGGSGGEQDVAWRMYGEIQASWQDRQLLLCDELKKSAYDRAWDLFKVLDDARSSPGPRPPKEWFALVDANAAVLNEFRAAFRRRFGDSPAPWDLVKRDADLPASRR